MARSRSRKRRWRLPLLLATLIGALAAVLAVWVVHLDAVVMREFQGRHWSVPAHVYAAPLELYVGAPVGAADLEEELRRLHYHAGDPAAGPGIYARRGDTVEVQARRVRFIDEVREPVRVSIRANGAAIADLKRADGRDLPVFRLDPLEIGSVSPVHGEDRLILAPTDVPPLLRAGIKLIEDRRFDQHHGIDPQGILRALWVDLRARHMAQGGKHADATAGQELFLVRRTDAQAQVDRGGHGVATRGAFLQGGDPPRLSQRGVSRAGWRACHSRLRPRQRVLLRQAAGRTRSWRDGALDRPGQGTFLLRSTQTSRPRPGAA